MRIFPTLLKCVFAAALLAATAAQAAIVTVAFSGEFLQQAEDLEPYFEGTQLHGWFKYEVTPGLEAYWHDDAIIAGAVQAGGVSASIAPGWNQITNYVDLPDNYPNGAQYLSGYNFAFAVAGGPDINGYTPGHVGLWLHTYTNIPNDIVTDYTLPLELDLHDFDVAIGYLQMNHGEWTGPAMYTITSLTTTLAISEPSVLLLVPFGLVLLVLAMRRSSDGADISL